jgi:hypothetical protein
MYSDLSKKRGTYRKRKNKKLKEILIEVGERDQAIKNNEYMYQPNIHLFSSEESPNKIF